MIGTRLADRYEVTGELGRGGMGVVYRAHDPLLNREVAVKVIPPTQLTPQAEERFRREAQLVAQMDHPGIVPIFDIGSHEGSLFFLMPVVRGTSLRAFLRDRSRKLRDLLEIGVRVAEALDYSHTHGVIHRDIKPENVMVSDEDDALRVRVMDFGLARSNTDGRITRTGTLIGTVSYFSPEQLTGVGVDRRSDIYSLGTVLYECIAGEPPFTGEVQSVLYRIAHEIPPSLRGLGAGISEELESIIMRSLAKDPARRYQTAGELATVLEQYRSQIGDEEQARSFQISKAITMQFARPPASLFVGREREIAELQRRLHSAIEGECHFTIIGGEPGIGKTRLLEEIENLARARKIKVLHGRFVEQDRTFPYQGFCEVILEYFRSRDSGSSAEQPDFSDLAAELVSLFPMLGEISSLRAAAGSAGDTEPKKGDDRTYVYELLARTLTRIGAGRPLVLILENLHGAEMSIDALSYVVRRLGPTPTLITATYRQTDLDRRHPLTRMIDGFRDDPRFASFVLGPLSIAEHRRFVESMVGSAPVSDSLARKLYESTEANPFFTRELVRSLIESGGIAKTVTGDWHLSREMGISVDRLPETIQQTVERRIERLPEEVRETLSIASVLGKTFEFRDIELLTDDRRVSEESIDRLIQDGIVEEEKESRGDRFTFASGIVRDVLYGALSRRRRKSLHRRYAELLEQRHAGRLERVYPQLVHHFSEGDVSEKTVQYGLELARRSLDAFAPEETVQAARTVLEFLEDEDWHGEEPAIGDARLLLASAQRILGNFEPALREVEQAVRIFEKLSIPGRTAEAIHLAAQISWHARRVEETRRWLAYGIEVARSAGERAVLVKLLSLAATVASLRGEYDQAKEALDEMTRIEEAVSPEKHEAVASSGGVVTVGLVNPIAAREPAEISIDEEGEFLALVFESLVETDDEGRLIPLLCRRWEILDDGRSLLFTLRPEVRFHDGTPLTAATVKRSFERSIRRRQRDMSPAFASIRGAAEFRAGEASEVIGLVVRSDNKIEIQIHEPLPFYPAMLTDPAAAILHVTEESVAREPDDVAGSGPFRIASQSAERLTLDAVKDWWKGSGAGIDSLDVRLLPSASALASELRSGGIDIARDLLPQDLDEILRDPRLREGHVEAPKKNSYLLVFNTFGLKGGNEALRRALCGVLRIHDVVWRTLGRLAQPASSVIPPGIFGHDPGRRRNTFTREQASELVLSSGLELPVRLVASAHPLFHDRYRSLMTAILEAWREIGVEVTFARTSMSAFLASSTNTEGIDLRIGRWIADYDDPDTFAHGLFHTKDGLFARYYSSLDLDGLIEGARTENRPAVREALYRRFESLLGDSGAVLPLFHEIDYRIAAPRVRGLQLHNSPPYVNYQQIGISEESRAPQTGGATGIITVPIAESLRDLNPTRAYTVERSEVIANIFETLTRSVEGARIVPWLASEFHAEEGGTRFRFRLQDARFQDGRRLNARDVRHSWERLLLDRDSPNRWLLAPIRGADAMINDRAKDLSGFRIISPREFVVELERPVSFFAALISHPSASILQEGTDEVKGTWREQCVGTGPFRLVQFEIGHKVELERNPLYWRRGFPKSEGLIFRLGVKPDETRRDFLSGRLSLASELFPRDVEELRHDPVLAAGYREVPRLSIYFVALNARKGPLADPALRLALIRKIDVASIVTRTLGRLGIPAHGIIPPGLVGYSPEPAHLGRDLESDSSLDLDLTVNMHPMYHGQYSVFTKELFEAFRVRGVKLRPVNQTMAEFLDVQNLAAADLSFGRWVADYPDTDTFAHGMLHSKGGAIGRFCGSPAIDRLCDRGRSELDPAVRHAVYRQIEEILSRDALVLPLFHEQVYRFARPEVEGLVLNFAAPEVGYENLRLKA